MSGELLEPNVISTNALITSCEKGLDSVFDERPSLLLQSYLPQKVGLRWVPGGCKVLRRYDWSPGAS